MVVLGLKDEFLALLERDKEFRYAVAGFLGLEEILKRLDRHEEQLVKLREDFNRKCEEDSKRFLSIESEIAKLREDLNKLREDMVTGFKRHDEEIAKLREDMVIGFKRHDEEIAKLREDMVRSFELVERHISAIGARWGIMSGEAFREGLKGLLEKEFKLKVERWTGFDGEGLVYGYPCQVEVDVAIHNKKIVLVEVKSHIRASDVYTFKRKAELYMKLTGKKPDRLLMVTPYAEDKALEAAKNLNIEIYTKI